MIIDYRTKILIVIGLGAFLIVASASPMMMLIHAAITAFSVWIITKREEGPW